MCELCLLAPRHDGNVVLAGVLDYGDVAIMSLSTKLSLIESYRHGEINNWESKFLLLTVLEGISFMDFLWSKFWVGDVTFIKAVLPMSSIALPKSVTLVSPFLMFTVSENLSISGGHLRMSLFTFSVSLLYESTASSICVVFLVGLCSSYWWEDSHFKPNF